MGSNEVREDEKRPLNERIRRNHSGNQLSIQKFKVLEKKNTHFYLSYLINLIPYFH